MPITDWKDASGADVDRRTLPDGRHMEVFIPGNLVIKWWWQLVLPSFDIEAQGRAETRSEAIAAVERAAGIPPAQAQASQASESFGPYSAAEVAVEWPSPFDDAQAREVMPRSYLVNAAALPEGASLFEAFKYPPQTPMEASVARGRFCRRLSVAGLPECRLPLGHEGAHITAYVETEELMDRCATMLREQGAASVARAEPGAVKRVAAVLAENHALRAQVQALTEENSQARAAIVEFQNASGLCVPPEEDGGDPGGVKPKHVERYIAKTEKERDAALADLRDARALAFRALTRITPLSGSQRIMVLGWEKYESAFAFGADGSGK